MLGLLDRINARHRGDEQRFGIDGWISDYLTPSNQFNYSGHTYPFGLNQSMVPRQSKEISATLPGYLSALRTCPPAFASQMYRALVLSQARFVFRNNRISRTPGRLFGTSALGLLEKPWPKATTGELVSRMEWHAGLAGNSYVTNRENNRLRVLRPDWVVIAYGSQQEPEDAAQALDGEVIGYLYCNGGIAAGRNKIWTLLPDEMAHWSPLPDPEGANIGMSWITPALREIQGDRAATEHKLQFFNNAGTPNMVVNGLTAQTKEQFNDMVDMMESRHAGVRNAYRTLYLQAGADATVVGANLQQMDFKNTQGAGETRITQLSRVHPVLLGSSEGLQGSSLNAGNFGAARRMFADSWLYPTLQDLAATVAELVRVPGDADLWTDTSDMPILREDAKDAAEIEQLKQTTINGYVREGWTPESAKAAVDGQDVKLLQHTGLVSVQLQPPGTTAADTQAGGAGPKAPAVTAARAQEPDDYDDDEAVAALIAALAELDDLDDDRSAFDPAKHPRNPKGGPGGGRFRSLVDRIIDAITEHHKGGGKGDPFEGFDREQLRKVAKARGIELSRGESRESIAAKLLADVGKGKTAKGTTTAPNWDKAKSGATGIRSAPVSLGNMNRKLSEAGLSDEEVFDIQDAFESYQDRAYRTINRHLLGTLKPGEDSQTPADYVAQMDIAFNASPMTHDAIVYRGERDPSRHFAPGKWNPSGGMEGKEWTFNAYASTSADISQADHFATFQPKGRAAPEHPTVVKILVPKGTKAINLSEGSVAHHELELLLYRGLRYRIVKDHGVVRKIRRIDVEVVWS